MGKLFLLSEKIRFVILLLIWVFVIFSLGCRKPTPDTSKVHEPTGDWKTVQYNKHQYIMWYSVGYAGGITHDPDCPCYQLFNSKI